MSKYKVKEFFIGENTNTTSFFKAIGIPLSEKVVEVMTGVILKDNNYVGSFKFTYRDTLYSIYILPKILPIKEDFSEPLQLTKDKFVHYMNICYGLFLNRNEMLKKKLSNFEYIAPKINSGSCFEMISNLVTIQFHEALKVVTDFLIKAKPIESERYDFISQNITNHIDIGKHIKSVNKSDINQYDYRLLDKLETISYIYSVLREFLNHVHNGNLFDKNQRREYLLKTQSAIRIINTKFTVDRIDSNKLTTIKGGKVFSKIPNIYKALLVLLRKECIFSEENLAIESTPNNLQIILFKPSSVFECFLFETLSKKTLGKKLEFEPIFNYIETNTLCPDEPKTLKAEPDITIGDINNKQELFVICDAKWKRGNPKPEDILKLYRDLLVIKKLHPEERDFETILYYPKIPGAVDYSLTHSYTSNEDKYIVNIKYIDMFEGFTQK